jgi:Cys-tRNA(Pro)/Cys-tRNA(Cys) deacylase
MTPAIKLLEQHKKPFRIHEYAHDSSAESYGLEACERLDVPAEQVFKTLVVELDSGELAVGIVPVDALLAIKAIAKSLSAKKAKMAQPDDVIRSTGYVLGGVSPLGQKKRLQTVIDSSATKLQSIFVSAGKRGLEIELAPSDLAELCDAQFSSIAQHRDAS